MTAPYPEAPRYSAEATFVKGNPLNNDYYVQQYQDDPWFFIISFTHDRLKALVPGYNIAQIKDKFGGLRYYYDKGDCPDDVWEAKREAVQRVVQYAEAWVDGYEYRKREAGR
jgi:hypothetical protein